MKSRDGWSRLIRGASPQKRTVDTSSPQVRLAHFKKGYNTLLKIWHNGDIVSTDSFAAENTRICLHRLAELLNADQRGPTPHLCVSFAATSRLLVTVARLSAAFENDGVTHEALGICSLLIDSEEEAFLEDRAFANTLPEFVESIQRCSVHMGDTNMEGSLLELLFGVTAKLRLEPHMLRVWFQPEKPDEDDEDLSDSERRTKFEEFPLFYLMLHYVSAEGRMGEFARMGMLYLIEVVPHSEDLERWIIDGDMAALMASSLGALYSQLGRKLAITIEKDDAPAILKFSDRLNEDPPPVDVEMTTAPEFQSHLATFLSSLVFWQDLLEHCASQEVKQTLLDHFQYLFLQQLLYPSLLESSEVDGGSAVAVLTYLRHILDSIDHPDLVRVTFQYLFGQEIALGEPDNSQKPISKARRRKSEVLIARLDPEWKEVTPGLFSLTDLITTSLLSQNQQVLSATLQLFSTLLRRPGHGDIPGLLRTKPYRLDEDQRTVGAHEQEVDQLLTLAENVTAFQDLESSFERHLHDNRNILEAHPCSINLLKLPTATYDAGTKPETSAELVIPRLLSADDPILRNIVSAMKQFFKNEMETNLNLTQALIDLASCGYLHTEGWLVTHPSKYTFKESAQQAERQSDGENGQILSKEEALQVQLHSISLARRHPIWQPEEASPVHEALRKLIEEAEAFHHDIKDFDTHLLECRNMIEGNDEETIIVSNLSVASQPLPSPTRSPNRRAAGGSHSRTESIPERLKSDRAFGGDAARGSSRGRNHDASNAAAIAGKLGDARASHSRGTSRNSVPPHSPSRAPKQFPQAADPSALGTRLGQASAALARRIKIGSGRVKSEGRAREGADEADEADADGSDETASEVDSEDSDAVSTAEKQDRKEDVSLGQLLTNMVILQEFILELAAVIEVRATLFGEVKQM